MAPNVLPYAVATYSDVLIAHAPRKPLLRRLYDLIVAVQTARAEREIATHLAAARHWPAATPVTPRQR